MTEANPYLDDYKAASTLFDQGKYEEAFARYRALAQAGFITAQVFVGWLYYKGQGVKQDHEEARQWLEKAADAGSPVGQFYLGAMYRAQQNYQPAIEYFKKSALQGYMPAIHYLGIMHDAGEGVTVDRAKAHKYFQQAADMGHLPAQKEIAVSMIKGHRGLFRIPQGIFMFARALSKLIKLALSDADNDRIRW
jgi:hypothetical protein